MPEQILVVDDDKAMLDVIIDMCHAEGHDVKGVTEGKDVSRTVRDQSTRSNEKYVITGDKGVIFTLAVENQFKYDAEF